MRLTSTTLKGTAHMLAILALMQIMGQDPSTGATSLQLVRAGEPIAVEQCMEYAKTINTDPDLPFIAACMPVLPTATS